MMVALAFNELRKEVGWQTFQLPILHTAVIFPWHFQFEPESELLQKGQQFKLCKVLLQRAVYYICGMISASASAKNCINHKFKGSSSTYDNYIHISKISNIF